VLRSYMEEVPANSILLACFYGVLWSVMELRKALSRRKHGFDSRRARQKSLKNFVAKCDRSSRTENAGALTGAGIIVVASWRAPSPAARATLKLLSAARSPPSMHRDYGASLIGEAQTVADRRTSIVRRTERRKHLSVLSCPGYPVRRWSGSSPKQRYYHRRGRRYCTRRFQYRSSECRAGPTGSNR
jgi:hypothetical protein